MKAKVLSVYDEGSVVGTSLIGAKGLSVMIDADDRRILFDTGLRGNYLMHNIDHLEIDVNSVDTVVISHMHSDHIGGLSAFLERRKEKVDVILPKDHAAVRKVRVMGIPVERTGFPKMRPEQEGNMNPVAAEGTMRLSDHIMLLCVSGNETLPQENFLVLETKNGPVLICGCCHCGMEAAFRCAEEATKKKVSAVVGGVHLTHMKKSEVHGTAEMLSQHGIPSLYLNHCSGQTQRTHLREKLGLKAVKDFYAGTEIHFDL